MKRKREKDETRQRPTEQTAVTNSKSALIAAALITIATFIVYLRVARFDFINLDDDVYVYENAMVTAGLTAKTIAWAFSSFYATNWHPVTWISHQIDASMFGGNAGNHHLVNVVLHIANSILLFSLVRSMTGSLWKSAIVAAIFAIHPTHVESVAWVAERKDVLSTLFWLLATIAYVRFTKDVAEKRFYWIALVLFAIGLMSKPMLVTFPFALLLLDYWPLKRIDEVRWTNLRPLVFEKLPFFALSIISAVVTVIAQGSGGAVQSLELFPVKDRLLNALVSYGKYVVMMFYPADLGVWYPFDANFPVWQIVASALLLVGVSVIAVWQIRSRPYLFTGWFWFLGTLVPVIGLVQVGRQSLADRYTYIPYIGLSIAVIWLFADVASGLKIPRVALRIAGVAGVVALAVVAYGQVSYWRNSETLYTRTLQVSPRNYLVEANYCRYLEKLNRLEEATTHCARAVETDPRGITALNTLGTILMKQGKLDESRKNLLSAIEIDPGYALPYANMSLVETRQQNLAEALEYFEQAVARDKDGFFDADLRTQGFASIGNAATMQKKFDIAAKSFEHALETSPDNLEIQRSLANAYRSIGRNEDAIKLLEAVVRKNQTAEACNSLGIAYAEVGRRDDAITQFQRALQINPNFAPAQTNLKKATE